MSVVVLPEDRRVLGDGIFRFHGCEDDIPVSEWVLPSVEDTDPEFQQWAKGLKHPWKFVWANPSKKSGLWYDEDGVKEKYTVYMADIAIEFDDPDDAVLFKLFWC